jgi:hypothetical protein
MLELPAALDSRFLVMKVIQVFPCRADFGTPIPSRGHQHLHDPSDGAAPGLLVPVEPAPKEEAPNGERHSHRGDAESPTPSHMHLDVHERGRGNERTDVDGEVEPVEERRLALLLFRVVLVKLVGSKGGHAWFDAPCAQGYEVEGQVEDAELCGGHLAGSRFQCRHGGREREQHHSLQDI